MMIAFETLDFAQKWPSGRCCRFHLKAVGGVCHAFDEHHNLKWHYFLAFSWWYGRCCWSWSQIGSGPFVIAGDAQSGRVMRSFQAGLPVAGLITCLLFAKLVLLSQISAWGLNRKETVWINNKWKFGIWHTFGRDPSIFCALGLVQELPWYQSGRFATLTSWIGLAHTRGRLGVASTLLLLSLSVPNLLLIVIWLRAIVASFHWWHYLPSPYVRPGLWPSLC